MFKIWNFSFLGANVCPYFSLVQTHYYFSLYFCFVSIPTSDSLLSLYVLLFRFYINFRLIIESLRTYVSFLYQLHTHYWVSVYFCFVFISTLDSLLKVSLFFCFVFISTLDSLLCLQRRVRPGYTLTYIHAPSPSLFFFVPSFALHHLIFSLFFLMSYPLCRYKRSTIDLIFLVKVSFLNKTQKNVLKKINW
jgi:hypothetical protein